MSSRWNPTHPSTFLFLSYLVFWPKFFIWGVLCPPPDVPKNSLMFPTPGPSGPTRFRFPWAPPLPVLLVHVSFFCLFFWLDREGWLGARAVIFPWAFLGLAPFLQDKLNGGWFGPPPPVSQCISQLLFNSGCLVLGPPRDRPPKSDVQS